jgi:glycosyltransferase involved in cell wall biosynthesis
MTAFVSQTDLKDQSIIKATKDPVFQPHMVYVPEQAIDAVHLIPKGLYAVLPALNEDLVIGSVVLRTRLFAEKVIVVDDGSSDRTAEIAKLAGADVIRLDKRTGKAYAILLGLQTARKQGCTLAIMLDADGQHDPREIPRLTKLIMEDKADLVIGSRFLEKKGKVPIYRQIGQKILDLFTNMSANTKVTDSQSGFRALSGKALDNLDFNTEGYNVESDMIAHFSMLGLRIMEVPISVIYDVPNKHKRNPFTHGMGVLTRLVNLIGYRRPLLAFGIPGFVLAAGGLVAEVWVFAQFSGTGNFHYVVAIGSAFILLFGMLLMICGLILNTLLLMIKEK